MANEKLDNEKYESSTDAYILNALCMNAIRKERPMELLSSLMACVLSMQDLMVNACDSDEQKMDVGTELVKATLNELAEATQKLKFLPYKTYIKYYKTKGDEKINND